MNFGIGKSPAGRHGGFGAGHRGKDGIGRHRQHHKANAAHAAQGNVMGAGAPGKGAESPGHSKAGGLGERIRAKMKAKKIERTQKKINKVEAKLASATGTKQQILQQRLQHLVQKLQHLTGQAGPVAASTGAPGANAGAGAGGGPSGPVAA